jgi:hypothetical protein
MADRSRPAHDDTAWDAAGFALKISPIGEVPARESHIRPLLERLSSREGYTDDNRISVWRDVLTRANGSHIKASDVDDRCTMLLLVVLWLR